METLRQLAYEVEKCLEKGDRNTADIINLRIKSRLRNKSWSYS